MALWAASASARDGRLPGLVHQRQRLGLAHLVRAGHRHRPGPAGQDRVEQVQRRLAGTMTAEGFYYSRYDAPRAGRDLRGRQLLPEALLPSDWARPRTGTCWSTNGPTRRNGASAATSATTAAIWSSRIWQGTSRNNRLYYKDLPDKSKRVNPLLDAFDAELRVHRQRRAGLLHPDQPGRSARAAHRRRPRPTPIAAAWRTAHSRGPKTRSIGAASSADSFVVVYHAGRGQRGQASTTWKAASAEIALPGLGSVGGFDGSPEDTETYYTFNSYPEPGEIYHYDFRTGTQHPVPQARDRLRLRRPTQPARSSSPARTAPACRCSWSTAGI